MKRFIPHVTVATVVEDQGRFLLVEEHAEGRVVLNQPAGHLEADESLPQAALRETLEETGWEVELTGVTGIYLYTAPTNGVTYQRVCFAARPLRHRPELQLDDGIIGPRWLTRAELEERREQWRSALVPRCIDDYLAGGCYPLELIREPALLPTDQQAGTPSSRDGRQT
ncbi:NUDIX hydrolase [Pseudomonas oryzae]|uniref:Phosphatase NudJ n=1 Tax=Pseudomonas oryzae TaxID=1392877 RepID=A0A1H1MSE8_9PSED|nr:NUDIX hydrolase [Pseudomonas oryzae]SDR88819.1 ADP-ribose pyrophosphatase YjhB, NUDIX family [Pseudomonas oryzae]